MMNLQDVQGWLKPLILLAAALVPLTGCVLELEDEATSASATVTDVQISGSVGDGPVTGATITAYSSTGDVLGTFTSDSGASFRGLVKVKGSHYPLRLSATGGTDLVTGTVPDFEMVSVVTSPSDKIVNINPFTTLIVGVAESMPGGLNRSNVDIAMGYVMGKLGFGLSSVAVPDPITTVIDNDNVAEIVKASEAMGEMVRRTRDRITGAGSPVDGDAVLAALAGDMVDGILDGRGASGTHPLVSATAKVVSAQVLIEALSNNLKVGGVIATAIIDQSIISTHGGVTSSQLTGNVRITQGMLEQSRASLAAVRVLDVSAPVASTAATVDSLVADSLPSNIESMLPVSSADVLNNAVNLVPVATQSDIDAINQAASPDGGSSNLVNSVPVISGSPAGTVTVNNSYNFQPAATDADGDKLTFSVVNKPSWASFNTANGVLSGTPSDAQAGTYSNIVISVTDGTDVASLPGFSIQAVQAPVVNTPPVISGSPAGSVFTNSGYVFQPAATDADGDKLTFSIVNKPSWASFNTANGVLSGTPSDTQAGTYSNIVISVTDGTDVASLPGFSIQVNASLGSISLAWTAPAMRADGSSLSLADIDAYRVYYGPAQGNYTNSVTINDGSATSAVINNIQTGTWYLVMTTIDVNGLESGQSGAISKVAN
jgi:hypothetical protein